LHKALFSMRIFNCGKIPPKEGMAMKKQLLIIMMATILLVTVFAGCTTSTNVTTTPSSASTQVTKELRIGALMPLSGDATGIGRSAQAALAVAENDINTYLATINSSVRIRFLPLDTRSDPATALDDLKALHAQGIHVVIGPASSAEVNATWRYALENDMILVSYVSAAPSLAIPNNNVFRFVPDATHEVAAAAQLMQEDGVKAVVPLWRDDTWGNDYVATLRTDVEKNGGTVAEGVRYVPSTTDFSSALTALTAQVRQAVEQHGATAVAVQVIGFDEVPNIFAQASSDSQLASVRWYGGTGEPLSLIATTPSAAQFAVKTGFVAPELADGWGDRFEQVKAQVTEKLGHVPQPYAYAAYDSAWVITIAYLETRSDAASVMNVAIPFVADSYYGITGNTALNAAGDLKFARHDFWSLTQENDTYTWKKVGSYSEDPMTGKGVITRMG
jgi:branched-chain amino acid transport system substrate-binding protein